MDNASSVDHGASTGRPAEVEPPRPNFPQKTRCIVAVRDMALRITSRDSGGGPDTDCGGTMFHAHPRVVGQEPVPALPAIWMMILAPVDRYPLSTEPVV